MNNCHFTFLKKSINDYNKDNVFVSIKPPHEIIAPTNSFGNTHSRANEYLNVMILQFTPDEVDKRCEVLSYIFTHANECYSDKEQFLFDFANLLQEVTENNNINFGFYKDLVHKPTLLYTFSQAFVARNNLLKNNNDENKDALKKLSLSFANDDITLEDFCDEIHEKSKKKK